MANVEIAWASKVNDDFTLAVIQMCKNLRWNAVQVSQVMSCMAFESGETFSPSVKNMAGSGATGLIQFMPSTARSLGTTVEDLAKMTDVQQLFYVEKHFKPYARRVKTLSDMYMSILMPVFVGADEGAILFRRGTVAYRQNLGLDANRDGHVTKSEAAKKVLQKYEKGMKLSKSFEVRWS